MSEREHLFSDEEVAKIFDRATAAEAELPTLESGTGLSLAQLQQIGAEAGIPAARISDAARAVLAGAAPGTAATLLGLPLSVERVIHLSDGLNDEEWGRLVADLRKTFEAQGELEAHGALRSWTCPGVGVHMEPDSEGYRIRMTKTIAGVKSGTTASLALLIFAIFMGMMLTTGNIEEQGIVAIRIMVWLFAAGGVGLMAATRSRLPIWEATSEAQLEGLVQRLLPTQTPLEEPGE